MIQQRQEDQIKGKVEMTKKRGQGETKNWFVKVQVQAAKVIN